MRKLLIIILCTIFALGGCSTPLVQKDQEDAAPLQKMNETAKQEKQEQTEIPQAVKVETKEAVKEANEAHQVVVAEPVKMDPRSLTSKRKTSYAHFNTICFAVVFDDFTTKSALVRFEKAWQEINVMLSNVENKVSVNLVDSDIYKFNQAKCGENIAVSPITAEIIDRAIKMYELTEGAYNPAVANSVDLWGFSPRFLNNETKSMPYDRQRNQDGSFDLPDHRYVQAFQKLSDFSKVKLGKNKDGSYYLTKTVKDIELDGVVYSLKLDLGGIAKGYGADKAAEILKKHGYEYGYVNLGLSSMKLLKRNVSEAGAPEDYMWSIHMSDPNNPSKEYLTGFGKDAGVSTSGTYEVRYTLHDRVYSHIIDPHTGEPTRSDVLSVSVWGGEASNADALTTALCVMGKETATRFMNTHLVNYQVAFVVKNGDKLELVTNIPNGKYLLYN